MAVIPLIGVPITTWHLPKTRRALRCVAIPKDASYVLVDGPAIMFAASPTNAEEQLELLGYKRLT